MFMFSCKYDYLVTPDDGGPATFKYAQEQKNAGFYFSGTWCGPCGLYGKPALENMSAKYGDNFVWISSQLIDPFSNADANALAIAFGVTAVPTIFVSSNGDPFQNAWGGTAMESTLDSFLTSGVIKTPTANIGINYTISDGAITGIAEVEYFEDSDKEFFVGLYMIENNLLERQYVTNTGWVDSTSFYNILRMKLSNSVTGDPLPIETKTKGKIDVVIFGDFLQSSWQTENLKVIAVLWTKNSTGELTAVNATIK
mgnify:CR=1 FL=1